MDPCDSRSSSQAEHEETPQQQSSAGSEVLAGPEAASSGAHGAQNDATRNLNIPEVFFCCFICYGVVKKPRLCPKCSHFSCYECLKKWYSTPAISASGAPSTTNNSQCPHCRFPVQMDHYIKCPWVEELVQQLQNDSNKINIDKILNDRCSVHQEQKTVFCNTCQTCICSGCALFSGEHSMHSFSPIDTVYRAKKGALRLEMEKLLMRMRTLEGKRKLLDRSVRRVKASKDETVREGQLIVEAMTRDLSKQMTEKLVELHGDRGLIVFEIEIVGQVLRSMKDVLNKAPKSNLVGQSEELLKEATNVLDREIPSFQPLQGIQYKSTIVPSYTGDVFVIRDFDKLADNAEPIFSHAVLSGGLRWRLKVYPNYKPGGLPDSAAWLSVFLELHDGPPGSHFHEYRIDLVHLGTMANRSDANPEKNVCKEFSSKFEAGECWGSNRFYVRDQLAVDGFLNNGILALKFEIRPPNYSKAYEYAEWSLEKCEAMCKDLKDENKELKEFIVKELWNRNIHSKEAVGQPECSEVLFNSEEDLRLFDNETTSSGIAHLTSRLENVQLRDPESAQCSSNQEFHYDDSRRQHFRIPHESPMSYFGESSNDYAFDSRLTLADLRQVIATAREHYPEAGTFNMDAFEEAVRAASEERAAEGEGRHTPLNTLTDPVPDGFSVARVVPESPSSSRAPCSSQRRRLLCLTDDEDSEGTGDASPTARHLS